MSIMPFNFVYYLKNYCFIIRQIPPRRHLFPWVTSQVAMTHKTGDRTGALHFNLLTSKQDCCSLYIAKTATALFERITAIMNIKRTATISFLSACLIVFVAAGLFAASTIVSADSKISRRNKTNVMPAASESKTNADTPAADRKSAATVIHESVDILHYEDGAPYIHDILTNNTGRTITETQYCMLAYNENGSPLKLYWNFLDSSAKSSFENIVRTKTNILSGQTEEYQGGWSLYDGEAMKDFPKAGNGEANQAAYALLCLKQVVFEDGTVWNNPDYESWFQTYAGKETGIDELQDYYPYEYQIESK